jgi:hypothetical protein
MIIASGVLLATPSQAAPWATGVFVGKSLAETSGLISTKCLEGEYTLELNDDRSVVCSKVYQPLKFYSVYKLVVSGRDTIVQVQGYRITEYGNKVMEDDDESVSLSKNILMAWGAKKLP